MTTNGTTNDEMTTLARQVTAFVQAADKITAAGRRIITSQTSGGEAGQTLAPPDVLRGVLRNLTQASLFADPVLARDREIQAMVNILLKRRKNNPILVGEAGVGKTAIVEGVASIIANYPMMDGTEIWQVDIPALQSRAKGQGDFEELLTLLIKWVEEQNGRVIPFIDEVHLILQAHGGMNAGDILKPSLARGLKMIGATTYDEYHQYIVSDPALERRFSPVFVEEPSERTTAMILAGVAYKYRGFHGVPYNKKSINALVTLSGRYVPERTFPDKALDLMDEAGGYVRRMMHSETDPTVMELLRLRADVAKGLSGLMDLRRKKVPVEGLGDAVKRGNTLLTTFQDRLSRAGKPYIVTPKEVAAIIAKKTGIDESDLKQNDHERITDLPQRIGTTVIGQERALRKIQSVLLRAKLLGGQRPVRASMLFVGAPGAGKTSTAMMLADALYGSNSDLTLYYNMREFSDAGSALQFVGSGELRTPGLLVSGVHKKPYAVIVLDNFTFAHPTIVSALMTILSDGALRDYRGRKISFRNTTIVLISGVFINSAMEDWGSLDNYDALYRRLVSSDRFEPTLLNLLDEIVLFRGLTINDVIRITEKAVYRLVSHVHREHGVIFNVLGEVNTALAMGAFSIEFGAWHVERLVNFYIGTVIAETLAKGATAQVYTIDLRPEYRDNPEDAFRVGDTSRSPSEYLLVIPAKAE